MGGFSGQPTIERWYAELADWVETPAPEDLTLDWLHAGAVERARDCQRLTGALYKLTFAPNKQFAKMRFQCFETQRQWKRILDLNGVEYDISFWMRYDDIDLSSAEDIPVGDLFDPELEGLKLYVAELWNVRKSDGFIEIPRSIRKSLNQFLMGAGREASLWSMDWANGEG